MRLKRSWVILLYGAVNLINAQGSSMEGEQITPRSYTAYKANHVIQIDGEAREQDWKSAPWSTPFIDIEGDKIPPYATQMKMLWDQDHLYVYARLEEPHIWGTLKQRDTVIFYNNDFEIFIDPDGDTHNYVEFEMNVLNTVWDLFLTAPYRNNPKVLNQWDIKGLRSAVYIQGSLNDPRDIDEFWSLEVAIPWKALKEASANAMPPEGQFWRMGFSRVNWDFELAGNSYLRKKDASDAYLPEYNWVWSPQGVINMHEPEKWGYVFFSAQPPQNKHDFIMDEEERLKWFMYEQYRKILHAFKNGDPITALNWDTQTTLNGKLVQLELAPHQNGFILSCQSPFSTLTLLINTSGKFSSYETP